MVLVDSSIYIQLLRDGRDPVSELVERFGSTELVSCDIVRCEVLRGMVAMRARLDLAEFFDLLVHVPMNHRTWRETEQLAWRLDRAGKVIPLTDLIIAICALHSGAEILTQDAHFQKIPGLVMAAW